MNATEIRGDVRADRAVMTPTRADTRFRDLVSAAVEDQWGRFPYYRTLCSRSGRTLADLRAMVSAESYHDIPAVAATAFKRSKDLVGQLNDSSGPGAFQVSSSTSGDPSYVYTSADELARIREDYGRALTVAGARAGIAFAPSLRILRALSAKASLGGKKTVLRMLLAVEGTLSALPPTRVTTDVDVAGTLLGRLVGRAPVIRKMPPAEVAAIVRESSGRGWMLCFGGLTLLLRPYLDEFREGEFRLGERGHVAFSGGGWSGAKGSLRGGRIEKPAFVSRLGAVFGLPESRPDLVRDVYSFTETPAMISGAWDPSRGDFIFHPGPQVRVFIVDPEDERPLSAGRGLLKIVAPPRSGSMTAANAAILPFDCADIVSVGDGMRVEAFTRISRWEEAGSGERVGCAFKAAEISGD